MGAPREFPYPEHAEREWRQIHTLSDSQWQELVLRFEAGLPEAADPARTGRALAERSS
jgi:hypothetical protein